MIALQPTETFSLRRDQFDDLRRRHPQIDRILVNVLAARVKQQNEALIDAYFAVADTRVAPAALHRRARVAPGPPRISREGGASG